MMNNFILIMVMIGTISFISKRNHLLMSLMSVEFLTMMIFSGLIYLLVNNIIEGYVGLYYLVMSACEGALGLSIIVVMARGVGNDFIFSGMILQC